MYNSNGYIPAPRNLDDIILPPQFDPLIDKIAEDVHERWSFGRYSSGWRYGEKRDDEKKLHPDLRPYSELDDEEKSYDRNTAVQSIKLLVALGWTLTPPSEE